MNEALPEVLEWLKTRVDGTEKFVLEQAPLYAQEVVAWTLWSEAAKAVGILLLASLLVAPCICFWRRWLKDVGEPGWFFGGFFLTAAVVACLFGSFQSASQSLKASVAPRVLIVEHLRNQTSK